MQFSNQVYNNLKFIALVALPAFAVLYSGLGELWGLSWTDQIVGTIILIDAFLGALLQLSSSKFNRNPANFAGYLDADGVHPDTGMPNLKMTLTKLPEEILENKVIRLQIGKAPEQQS